METLITELLNNRVCYSRKNDKINLSFFMDEIINLISTIDLEQQKIICNIFESYMDYILKDCEIRHDLNDKEIIDITSELSRLSTIFFSMEEKKYNRVLSYLTELRRNYPLNEYHINQENKMENYPE